MAATSPHRKRWPVVLFADMATVLFLVLGNWLTASWLVCSSYDRLIAGLRHPAKELGAGRTFIQISELPSKSSKTRELGKLEVWARGGSFLAQIEYEGNRLELEQGDETRLWAPRSRALFSSERTGFTETQQALTEVAQALPGRGLLGRAALSVFAHPLITGVQRVNGELCWKVWFSHGSALISRSGWPCEAVITDPKRTKTWLLTARREPEAVADVARFGDVVAPPPRRGGAATSPADAKPVPVPPEELDRSLAAAIRILALPLQPSRSEPDRTAREGRGWLRIKDGRRVLRLSGSAREIGLQHGRLLAPNVKRVGERVLYGVGLVYSLEKGCWFLREMERLVERQRPYLAPEYFDEMRGVAEGAGVPVALVQAANFFPEFFHCSGVALLGKATKGGALLHARVLDYMTEVGLQDDAVVMAVERDGARRFVNVGYAGFIGSVTGMNEKQVAIGEMGGEGQGLWDGTPMSFLLRGALERCDTLEQALDYMRTRKRTCEYFYVISDGKSLTACGVAATPEKFETVAPGQYDPRLPDPVEDAVLLSAGDRYKELVKRVRAQYGRIGPQELMQIISRPVAMKSNLHDVIFEPQKLSLWVAQATRTGPACDQPYASYAWQDLFSPAP